MTIFRADLTSAKTMEILILMFQVGCISKKWNGVLKEVLTTADRFSVDFPPDIGKAPPAGYSRREEGSGAQQCKFSSL